MKSYVISSPVSYDLRRVALNFSLSLRPWSEFSKAAMR